MLKSLETIVFPVFPKSYHSQTIRLDVILNTAFIYYQCSTQQNNISHHSIFRDVIIFISIKALYI